MLALLLMTTDPAQLDGATILAKATEAAGGPDWANAKTLVLKGRAVFYAPDAAAPRTLAERYEMWRVLDPARTAAHGAEGKLRITAVASGKTIIDVGYDGATTWNERGVVPKAEADRLWANNFGFGIIRHAAKPGFKAVRLPDDAVDGHPAYMVRLTDPSGSDSLFGIDRTSFAIRMAGFVTPRGWHVRTYDDFFALDKPRWLQARKVTLTYNGVKQNEIYWDSVEVDVAVGDERFAVPPR